MKCKNCEMFGKDVPLKYETNEGLIRLFCDNCNYVYNVPIKEFVKLILKYEKPIKKRG